MGVQRAGRVGLGDDGTVSFVVRGEVPYVLWIHATEAGGVAAMSLNREN